MSISKFNNVRCSSRAPTLEALLNNSIILGIDHSTIMDWSFIEK
jgi:hypothetical protein